MLTIKANNYRGLQEINWKIPQGLSVLIGPNGAGKSTLLGVAQFLINLVLDDRGSDRAMTSSGGAETLRYKGNTEGTVSFEISLDDLLWELRLVPQNGGLARFPYERISAKGATLYERIAGNNIGKWNGQEVAIDGTSALKRLSDYSPKRDFAGDPLRQALENFRAFGDYDLSSIREGSRENQLWRLMPAGINVFTLLRTWDNTVEDRARRRFVVDGLRDCFPFFSDIEFATAGNMVAGIFRHATYKTKQDQFSMMAAPSGFLVALLHLCAVAGANPGEVIALDDFESCLHPEAITKLLTLIQEDAEARNFSVVIATQSPQVLNFFDDKPERVYIVDDRLRPSPKPLLALRNHSWLSYFRLGDKFMEGDFAGSTPEEPHKPEEP